jgi:predicted metal-dependent hydrolase
LAFHGFARLVGNGGIAPMSTATETFDPLYLQGIAYFNACEFFEAHEVWEELWKNYSGNLRLFYKGLIQAAVALHHFGNGNIRGARKVYHSSRGYLEAYRPVCVGLDLEQFLTQFDACFAEVAASQEEYPDIEMDPELIPEIALDPPAELPPVVAER